MSSPIQLGKTYGVLHTESYFSFLGFAKKVGSDETQKVDVFLNDKLIDTIEANEFIQKIDDMYDIENQAFSYNLPFKYIDGVKHQISFKYHNSSEELLNSPYILIDKNHEDFSEAKFMHSLSEPISEEMKNMYKPNSIGFLATKENLEDEEFVNYVKDIKGRFPDARFVGFCFQKPNDDFVEYIKIKDVKDIVSNACVIIVNPHLPTNILDRNIIQKQFQLPNVLISVLDKSNHKKLIKDIKFINLVNKIKKNLNAFNLNNKDINGISENHLLMILKSFEKTLNLKFIDKNKLLELNLVDIQKIYINVALNNKDFIAKQKSIHMILTQ